MKDWLFFLLLISFFSSNAQVGINTTNPSGASVLHIESSNNGVHFGGFLPPKVTLADRDNIAVGAGDDGMMIFVTDGDERCLQIYNEGRARWENIYCFNAVSSLEFVAAWEINGVSGYGSSPFDATTTITQVTVGGLTRGDGVTTDGAGASNAWGGNGWNDGSDLSSAIIADNFITFTLSPNTGSTLSLNSIAPYNIRRSASGPTTGQWQYSIDGNNYYNIGTEITWGEITAATGNLQNMIDLSGISDLQNISSSQTVTFRIVYWDASTPGGNWYINHFQLGEDFIIIGSVMP